MKLPLLGLALSALLQATISGQQGLWVNRDEILSLSASGAAWEDMVADAARSAPLDLSDQDDPNDSRLLAAVIVAIRTGGDLAPLKERAFAALETENGGRTLALARNLPALVLAMDLLELEGEERLRFETWLRAVLREDLDGRTLISTHEDRGNNWGTWAGAARFAADLYLRDYPDLQRASRVLAGWMGYRRSYALFRWGELDWQADPENPVGINPPGATRDGHSIDGVLPDEQRRAGGFTWPPPKENYCYEGLQGLVLSLVLLERAGLDAWSWKARAPYRAFRWLAVEAQFPAEGDDVWMVPIVNRKYGVALPVGSGSSHGKSVGWSEVFLELPSWP